jgi:preprotein translocase subunit SecY
MDDDNQSLFVRAREWLRDNSKEAEVAGFVIVLLLIVIGATVLALWFADQAPKRGLG